MYRNYANFEIEVAPRRGDVYPLSAKGPGGDASGELRLPMSDAAYVELEQQLANFKTDEDMLCRMGTLLFDALFQGEIKDVYHRSQGRLKENQGMRLTLNFSNTEAEVAALPWELLYDENSGGTLALTDMPIMRYIRHPSSLPSLAAQPPLKMLLAYAKTPPFVDNAREFAEVREALEEAEKNQGVVQIIVEEHLTAPILQQRLREGFHIWHFFGHGDLLPDGKTSALAFEDGTGDTRLISARELGMLLNRTTLRLVVLHACNTGTLSTDPFRSVAPALVRSQVPAVVAMQFRVAKSTTSAFASQFYRTLAEGFPIDACVTEGRKAVMGAIGLGRPDWAIPVVYSRAADGKLFETAGNAPVAQQEGQSRGVNVNIHTGDLRNSAISISEIGNISKGNDANQRSSNTSDQIEMLRDLIKTTKQRLHHRQIQKAKYGISADPSIDIEIEDLQREIADLERQVQQLGG
jgi:hypothetical protein